MSKGERPRELRVESWYDRDDNVANAIIETPRNQRHKYAFDEKTGMFRQSMMLAEGLQWPYDYGFIPGTLAADGDALDILFLGEEPTFTGCLLKARILGIVRLKKNGEENDRILGCPTPQKGLTQKSDAFDDVDDIPGDTIRNICHYLIDYSEAEGNDLEFEGAHSRKAAIKAIVKAQEAFEKQHKAKK
jgi:inorganic pyrophosphatase